MAEKNSIDLKPVADAFMILGDYLHAAPYGSGHINDTYLATFSQGGTIVPYILQRINHQVFTDPPALMDNIRRVTEHLQKKLIEQPEISRRTLSIIPTRDGKPIYRDNKDNFWRAYIFIEKAHTYDIVESEKQAWQAARAFGRFQQLLTDLPGERLHESIPDFHNTPSRFAKFKEALAVDSHGRAEHARAEIDFVLSREDDTGRLLQLNASGEIPERITHNDTKLNNIMLDDATGEGICVIDLDTVMPGLSLYDFGDLVRSATCSAPEDETDLNKVTMQMSMFEAIVRGYLKSAGCFLNHAEREYLPFSGKLISLEIGIRFLTDHLQGDTYFKIHRQNHNLDRARRQFALVKSIEKQLPEMQRLVSSSIIA